MTQGGRTVAGALPLAGSLRSVDLSGTGLGDDAALALAAALPSCRALEAVFIGGNCIADGGVLALLAALEAGACPTLRLLSLKDNRRVWLTCCVLPLRRSCIMHLTRVREFRADQLWLCWSSQLTRLAPPLPRPARFPLEWDTLLRMRDVAAARPGLRIELLGPSAIVRSPRSGAVSPRSVAGSPRSAAGSPLAARITCRGTGAGALAPLRCSAVTLGKLLSSSAGASTPSSARKSGPRHARTMSDWSVASDDLCGVCLDRPNSLHVRGCEHALCVPCYRRVLCASSAGGGAASVVPSCPFCRGRIEGFTYAGWLEAHLVAAPGSAAPFAGGRPNLA